MALVGEMQYLTIGDSTYSLPSSGGSGTVTSVGVSNATNGGLTISGSPITSSGSITIGHSNVLTSAQTTSAVYPIKIDKNGHISEYGSAVTIPSITLNGSSSTSPSFYAPTSAGTNNYVLKSNGSGAPSWTSAVLTDENLKWTASTTSNTYYPLVSTSTATTSTANTLNGIDFYQYYNTAGGYRRLDLGNTTAWKSSGGAYGTIRLYGAAATYYGDLVPGVLGTTSNDGHISANRTWTLPDKTGTIALTSDIPTVPTITLNGSSTTSASFYAPTGAGTSGNYLKSSGSGAPTWESFPTIPSITLNGSSSTSPSFYAPTSAGTSGYVLTSSGSGAPDWTSGVLTDENVKVESLTNGYTYYPIIARSTGTAVRQIDTFGLKYFASSAGESQITIGNKVASGGSGYRFGKLILGGTTAHETSIISGSPTDDRTITLPDNTGTVALTSDLPASVAPTELPVDSEFELNDADDPIKLRCWGKVVTISGGVKPKANIAGSADLHIICTVPPAYLPPREVIMVMQGSTTYRWCLRVNSTSGEVSFSRYGAGTSYAQASTSTWIQFHATWIID